MKTITVGIPDSNVHLTRVAAMRSLNKLAEQEGVTPDSYATAILVDSAPQLQWYVSGFNEIPLEDPKLLAAQAAILRADEITGVARSKGLNYGDALKAIEYAEQEAIDANADAVVLDPEVAAALCVEVEELRKRSGNKMDALLSKMRSRAKANNFMLNVGGMLSDPSFLQRGKFDNFDIPIPTSGPSITDVGTSGTDNGGFDWGTIGDIFDSISGAIGSIGTTAGGVSGAINSVINNVKNAGSEVGSNAIQDALMKKLPMILIGILAVAVIIILIAKYANRK